MNEAIDRLTSIIDWSDRLGSDEIHEIESIIQILKQEKDKNAK